MDREISIKIQQDWKMTKKTIKGLDGIPQEIIDALVSKGYKSVEGLSITLASDLSEDVMISRDMAEEIVEKSIAAVATPPITAADLLVDEQNRGKLSTGAHGLDALLDGGIWEKEITEISGGFATGKTQICFQLAVNAQLPKDQGGLAGKVFYIDTEGTFSAKRIGSIAVAMGLDPQSVLKNIFISHAMDSSHQTRLVKTVADMAKEHNIKLLIVDSIASHFRTDYIGKDQMIERQQRIMQHGSSLTNLARIHGLAVVVTNQVVANVDELTSSKDNRPALGQAWAHRPQTRVLLRRSPGLARIARLLDSPRHQEGEEFFYITPEGIRDRMNH